MPPPDLPAVGARVPGWAVRAAIVVAGAVLSVVDYRLTGWLVIGVALAVAAAWSPGYLCAWALIVFLALGELTRHGGLTWRFLVLLAGVHLLHVMAMLALEVPLRAWVQPAVFVAPLLRFVVIQVPTQAVAVVALLVLAPGSDGHRPVTIGAIAVIGTLALVGLLLLLFRVFGTQRSPES